MEAGRDESVELTEVRDTETALLGAPGPVRAHSPRQRNYGTKKHDSKLFVFLMLLLAACAGPGGA